MSKKRHYTSIVTTLFGKLANTKFPKPLQNCINMAYVKLMGLDMSRFDDPKSYDTLNLLFTRALKSEPSFDLLDKKSIISPVDALISDFGKIEQGKAYQIKGMSYTISELLTKQYKDDLFENGDFINFYLSPKDYHRYHMPFHAEILSVTHIPGKLYPVNMLLLRNKVNLFIENERVIVECRANSKKVYLILVGALNVGKMQLLFDPRVQTNAKIHEPTYYSYDNLVLKRGELFGYFEMGSTIVMLTQQSFMDVENIAIGEKVSFGDTIGTLI